MIKESDWKALDKEVRVTVEEAVRYADASPEPPVEWLCTDVYVSER